MSYLPFRKKVLIGHVEYTLYSVGWLVRLAGRHAQTIRGWERTGLIPKPIFDKQADPTVRYYTAGEIIGFTQIIKAARCAPGKGYPRNFKTMLHEFSTRLKQQIERDPHSVVKTLPEEEQLYAAMTARGGAKTKTAAALLVKELNAASLNVPVN